MPTYEYRCKDCGTELEVVQAFTDDALTTCEACGGALKKVFGSVGISFKGSGFYKNDSRGGSKGASSCGRRRRLVRGRRRLGDKGSSDGGSSSGDGSTATKAEPAAKAPKADTKPGQGLRHDQARQGHHRLLASAQRSLTAASPTRCCPPGGGRVRLKPSHRPLGPSLPRVPLALALRRRPRLRSALAIALAVLPSGSLVAGSVRGADRVRASWGRRVLVVVAHAGPADGARRATSMTPIAVEVPVGLAPPGGPRHGARRAAQSA